MLPDRLSDQELSSDMRRWFLESAYGMPSYENQDWDLALADWSRVPLLVEYAEDGAHPLEKRYEAFSALMILQGFQRAPDRGDVQQRKRLGEQVRQIVLNQPDFGRAVASDWLGLAESLIVLRILGEPISADTPQWVRDEMQRWKSDSE
jgi:hypothetical protein